MVVMRVADEQVGYVGRLEAAPLQVLQQRAAQAVAAAIQQYDAAMPAQQHHRAPAEAPMQHRLARVSRDQDLKVPAAALPLHARVPSLR